jgi:cytochrome c oxidase subunit 3
MASPAATTEATLEPQGLKSVVADFSSDQRAFKNVPWGKPMM